MPAVYQSGDYVVYHKHKFSAHPGPKARDISPAPYGEDYSFFVDKFWRVVAVAPGEVTVRTRRGKIHTLSTDNPALRRARWWERLLFRHRFPAHQPVEVPTPRP